MIDYTAHTIARLEYEEKIRSRAPMLDCDAWIKEDRPGWASLQVGHFVSVMKIGLAAVGKRLKTRRKAAPVNPRARQERGSVSG